MLRAVFFDFDGVLVNSEPMHFRLMREILGAEGFDLTFDLFEREFLALDDAASIELALGRTGGGLTPEKKAELLRVKATRFQAEIERGDVSWFPEVTGFEPVTSGL